ncbi:hypothetical protein [Rhodanobacter lindaniclasticus]
MLAVALHDAFVGEGCVGTTWPSRRCASAPARADRSLRRGDHQGSRDVQGGGCTTVGVAGLVQSGGFGSFSKHDGAAAAGLLEAEVVTADGQVRIAQQRARILTCTGASRAVAAAASAWSPG